ncbi:MULTISPECIES: hypothetical protein [Arthrobacter]|uniref:hypothetical protein n=1 Tax=Arthrobacter TaxID=1663 RepID=UPI00197AAA77|nr:MULTISPECIES: hypothetical protein [Arthrobacter]
MQFNSRSKTGKLSHRDTEADNLLRRNSIRDRSADPGLHGREVFASGQGRT